MIKGLDIGSMDKLQKKNEMIVSVGLVIGAVLLSFLFFHETWFAGKSIQGIDGNFSIRAIQVEGLSEHGSAMRIPYYWLGQGRAIWLNTKIFFLQYLPLEWSLSFGMAVILISAHIGMYKLLRRLGLDRMSSCFGAVGFAWTPHFITLIYPAHVDSFCLVGYIPWFFYFIIGALDTDEKHIRGWGYAVGMGVVWGLMMNDDVQRGLYVSVAGAAYILFHLFPKLRRLRTEIPALSMSLGKILVAGILMVLIFSNALVAQFGGARVSGKVAGVSSEGDDIVAQKWEFATSFSLPPKELVNTFAYGYHGKVSGDQEHPYWGPKPFTQSSDSIGYFVLLFALAGVISGFKSSRDIRFFFFAGALALLLAFGNFMPGKPFFWLWYHLPMMDKMRVPAKFMSVAVFAFSVLSAFGLNALFKVVRDENKKIITRWFIGGGIVLVVGIFLILSTVSGEQNITKDALSRLGNAEFAKSAYHTTVGSSIRMTLFALLTVLLMVLAWFMRRNTVVLGLVGAGFIALGAYDLVSIDRFYYKAALIKPTEFYRQDGAIRFLKENASGYRVASSIKVMHSENMVPLALVANQGHYVTYLFPYFKVESMESTPRARVSGDYNQFFNKHLSGLPAAGSAGQLVQSLLNSQVDFWRMTNVKYVMTDGFMYGISRQPIPVFEIMRRHADLKLVHTTTGLGNRKIAIFEVKDIRPRFMFTDSSGIGHQRTSNNGGSVTVEEESLFRIKLSISVEEDSTLIWNSRFDEDWHIEVDGNPTTPFEVDDILTGIPIPAGAESVLFSYAPDTRMLQVSRIVLFCSLAICILLLLPFKRKGEAI